MVDEYQDVNPLQKLLLDVWLGDRDDLCVVGDPNQTIYSFTGATHRYLTGFATEFPDATVVRLVRDYRSTPQVVAVANRLAAAPAATPGGRPGRRRPTPLVAQRPSGPEPVLTSYDDELAEAEGVAGCARSLIESGLPARQIAVLVRINAMLERFESAFAAAGVPYQVRGSERFYDRPEVRQAVMLLRGALRGRADGEQPGPLPAEVRNVAVRPRPDPGRARRGGASRQRWESLAAVAQLADDMYAARPDATLADFVAELHAPGGARSRAGPGRGDARLDARRQGPRMERGLAARAGGGGHADRLRPHARGGRGGTAAALRGGHAGPGTAVPVLAGLPAGRVAARQASHPVTWRNCVPPPGPARPARQTGSRAPRPPVTDGPGSAIMPRQQASTTRLVNPADEGATRQSSGVARPGADRAGYLPWPQPG